MSAAFDKRALLRDLDKEEKTARRQKVKDLAKRWHDESRALPSRLAAVRSACALERDALRKACAADADRERARVHATREAFRSERDDERALSRAERYGKKQAPRASRQERRAESDDEVRQNIPPEFAALFERVKRQIVGTARISRTEKFLQYVEEHPSEVFEATAAKAEREIHAHEKKERARKGPKKAGAPFVFSQAPEDEDAFRALLQNPGGPPCVALGHLTEITFMDSRRGLVTRRWPLDKAPLLAVTPSGKLSVLYAPEPVGKAPARARAKYTLLHWGNIGQGQELEALESQGPWKTLGPAKAIVYTTRKGSRELVDFDHEWGEGRTPGKRWARPTYVEHACADRSCRCRGWIAIRGGSYRVTTRGVVG